MKKKDLIFYTDGSCSKNPGPGGYGIICLDEENKQIKYQYSESFDLTTNNRMELSAILHVIKLANKYREYNFITFSDSAYAVNCINLWIYTWSENGWQNSKKKTIENIDLIKEIYKYIEFPLPNFILSKVDGHAGLLGNEAADRLATGNQKELDKLLKDYSFEGLLTFN